MIEACNRVGSVEHYMTALASAFTAVLTMGNDKWCFRCQQIGRFAANCPQKEGGSVASSLAPPGVYPHCKKGWHWASQCRSKYNAEGQTLQLRKGNGKPSIGRGHTMTQVPHGGRPTPNAMQAASWVMMTSVVAPSQNPLNASPWIPSLPKSEEVPEWISPQK